MIKSRYPILSYYFCYYLLLHQLTKKNATHSLHYVCPGIAVGRLPVQRNVPLEEGFKRARAWRRKGGRGLSFFLFFCLL